MTNTYSYAGALEEANTAPIKANKMKMKNLMVKSKLN
jgi:hypothetical protein